MPAAPGAAVETDVVVRTATPDDGDALMALDVATWSTEVSPAPSPDPGATFFAPGRLPADVLVAAMGESVVGYISMDYDIPLDFNSHVLMLRGLAVSPAHQRRGIGRMLMAASLAEARRRGARRVKSRVLSTNPASLLLHERCGFVVEGTLREEFLIAGTYVDDVLLAARID